MALEIEVEIESTELEVEVEISEEAENFEVDVIQSGPQGLSHVENQLGTNLADLLPGDIYVVTQFNTLQQKILGPVPLIVTPNILD